MSATRRGFIIFGVIVLVTASLCVWLPFFGLPKAGIGVGLLPFSLPAEVLAPKFLFFGIPLTNSITSMLVVDVLMLLIGFTVNRAVSGQVPERFVPRGLTNLIDMLVEFWYNQARTVLGDFAPRVIPLALTIFTFLLLANWIDLIPGNETIGYMRCAEAGKAGYPLIDPNSGITQLRVDGPSLKDRAGTKAAEADTQACEAAHPQFAAPVAEGAAQPASTGGEGSPAPTAPATKPSGSLELAAYVRPSDGAVASDQAQKANSELFNVAPFFRPLATDLNMPLALALILFIAVQIWGIQALGGAYFYKFINVPALGNISKNPMGVMDFVVGLVDIISELSRLISLSFRLLGNIFAGGVLLAVMSFLVATVLPVAFYGLELFAGAIQAYVFAILAVMYASQAVVAHGGEGHEEHDEHAHVEPAVQPGKIGNEVVDLP